MFFYPNYKQSQNYVYYLSEKNLKHHNLQPRGQSSGLIQ
jgi:hypothetical protein